MKLLEWRRQVQKEELKRPVVGLPSHFTELCRQGQNCLSGGVGSSGIMYVHGGEARNTWLIWCTSQQLGTLAPSRWAASWGSEGGACQGWHPCPLRPFFSGSFFCQSSGSHCQLMVGLAGVVLWRFLWLPANYRRSFWNQAVHFHGACLSRYLSFPTFASFSATACSIRLFSFISFIQNSS